MKLLFFFSFFLFALTSEAQLVPTLWQINKDKITSWLYYFGDEFTQEQLDDAKWFDNYPWGGLSIPNGIYAAPENTRLENGKAILKVDTCSYYRTFPAWMLEENTKKNDPLVVNGSVKLNYVTAALWSKIQFKYGYFECRCFIPEGKGLWPAFWLYGGKPNDEIDFMEAKGERKNEFHLDIHCPDDCDRVKTKPFNYKKLWGSWIKTKQPITGQWVVFSGVWLPGYVNFYMNGRPVAKYLGDFAAEMNMIANISVAVDGGAFDPGPDKNTTFPSEFAVDYMRVWKLPSDDFPSATHRGIFTEGKLTNLSQTDDDVIAQKKIGPLLALEGTESNSLKRKNRKTLPKELVESEQGFVSLMLVNEQDYQLHFNGITTSNLKVEILNDKGTRVKSFDTKSKYQFFSTSDFQVGNYNLVISNGENVKTAIPFTKQ